MSRARAVVASYVGVVAFAVPLFLAAGRVDYPQGLTYLAVALIGTTLVHLLEPPGSGRAAERARGAAGGEAWDKRLLVAHALTSLVMFVVAGLDSGRYFWTGPVPRALGVAGIVLMLTGQGLFAWARRVNVHFAASVRIEAEGHAVCERGPYAIVRHPGYLGLLLSQLAFPLILGSRWAAVPAMVGAVILARRTVREDGLLVAQVPGYAAYAARTRARLVPGMF